MFRLALPAALLATPALADQNGYGDMMNWGFGGGFMFGPLLWLIVLGLIVAGAVALARRPGQDGGGNDSGKDSRATPDPLAALDMRFANGEIDEAEYLARKKILRG